MAKGNKRFLKRKRIQFFAIIVIILLIICAGFVVYRYFFSAEKVNDYLIKNKYYGFELKTPQNWMAEKNTSYPEDVIGQLLDQCKNEKSNPFPLEVGAFRFKDQKYPQGFGETGNFTTNLPSGAILQAVVYCIPSGAKDGIVNYIYGNLQIGGEKAFAAFLNLLGFGKTKYISFYHGNFQYKISEYVYVSPADKTKDKEIRTKYSGIFDEIISSFKFVK